MAVVAVAPARGGAGARRLSVVAGGRARALRWALRVCSRVPKRQFRSDCRRRQGTEWTHSVEQRQLELVEAQGQASSFVFLMYRHRSIRQLPTRNSELDKRSATWAIAELRPISSRAT